MKTIKFKNWKIKVYKEKRGFWAKIINPENVHIDDTIFLTRFAKREYTGFNKTERGVVRSGKILINYILSLD